MKLIQQLKEEKEKEEELINSSIPTTTLLPLNKNINNLNNNTLQATEYNNTSSFLLENNLNNNLFNETTTQINKKEINKLNNNINPSIISSSVFVSPEKGEEEENKIILPKVFLPQKDEVEKINNNLNKEIKEQQQQQRQYGAKIIERASDGSFQEKITKINSSSLLPISSSNSLLNNNNPIKSTIFNNKKGAESTKKLHLKLIKDLNQKTNINNIITTTTSLPLNNNLLTTTNFFNNLIKEKINKKHENKQIEEFIPKLELEEPLNNDQSVEEHFEGSEGYFSLWGPWTPCTIPGERKIRRRKCLDLRKCRGSLTQVDYCSINNIKNNNEEEIDEEEEKINNKQNNDLFTTKNDLIIEREEPKPPGITPPPSHEIEQNLNNKQQKQFGILTSKNENNEEIWSKWNGTCQHFASSQPCKDGQVIGFESRECIAKDPLMCKGPFFRYCTLPC
ncbi:hypothetical protein Mgra_00008868 [Meloidogyne graminicola]|uniref:Uncharacterized protein n=1 Tax=Meloidogyne graminicola TaxID=189291 RepID=A0A8S9ZEG2_9BILA|nr:hypothetical protein Mgra_00008868 [Meloidogyne graminicola]